MKKIKRGAKKKALTPYKSQLQPTEYLSSDDIVRYLKELQQSQGWNIIVEFEGENIKRLEQNVKDIEKELLDGDITDTTKIIQLKEKRRYQLELIKTNVISIPQMIMDKIEELKSTQQNIPQIQLDPFDQVES